MSDAASFQLGRFLVLADVILVVLGLVFMAGSRFSFLGLGRLPGDIYVIGRSGGKEVVSNQPNVGGASF